MAHPDHPRDRVRRADAGQCGRAGAPKRVGLSGGSGSPTAIKSSINRAATSRTYIMLDGETLF